MATPLKIDDDNSLIGIGEALNIEDLFKPTVEASNRDNPLKSATHKHLLTKSDAKSKIVRKIIQYKTINGWTAKNQTYIRYCLYRLKYYRIINNFFFFELKKREGNLSWAIIVLSSFSSVLSLINTQQELFTYSSTLAKWFLVLITLIITLISAYIKKQQFIDKINTIDRYLQQLNQIVEELNITFILAPDKREGYDEFCKKYIPIIKNLSVSPASFSPNEWKRIVYTITKYYPELIQGDGTNNELLWPWFYMDDKERLSKLSDDQKREESRFGKNIITSYDYLRSTKKGYPSLHWFHKPKFQIAESETSINGSNKV